MNKEMNIDEMLAVLASDVKKLIKHFKLDRRRQGEEESPTAVEESAPDNETIQQIATAVKEISERKLFTEEQIDSMNRIINGVGHYFHKGNDERHTELKSLLETSSRTNNEMAIKLQEAIEILCDKQISVNTEKFEQLNRFFLSAMEAKIRKVKRPSKGLVWYIVMWVVTLLSAFLAGYYIHEYRKWKDNAIYWHSQYQQVTEPKK